MLTPAWGHHESVDEKPPDKFSNCLTQQWAFLPSELMNTIIMSMEHRCHVSTAVKLGIREKTKPCNLS
ncbi:hypothetical protein AVEN_51704-1 [Araneus ventricosus]|uniref:Uncharacterized protein n=1 Tax=Araneus ventricosus TaxID=182803 RepID=A0A4Y2MZP7_ARAVE|nr:hypothetical protein AVEN_51704-1 [Araneus ventricosus]